MQKFWFSVRIDGKVDYCAENTQPEGFNKVTVWASDPWCDPVNAKLRNIKIRTVNHLCKDDCPGDNYLQGFKSQPLPFDIEKFLGTDTKPRNEPYFKANLK